MEGKSPRVNRRVELVIDGVGAGGEGIGRLDGRAVFVPRTLPGERVLAKIVHIGSRKVVADPGKILKPSPDRRDPVCPVFGRCGGCQLMHADYPAQLEIKRTILKDALSSIAAAKAKLKDGTIVARLERDENCLRLTRLFLDFWSASGRFRRSGNNEDRQAAAEAGRAYLDLIGRVGGLTVGGDKIGYVKSVVADLTSGGTVFPESGRFVYEDDCNDGGRVYHALRRSGYEISKYGFSLRPNSEGEIVNPLCHSHTCHIRPVYCLLALRVDKGP